jgi:hypothetical protein
MTAFVAQLGERKTEDLKVRGSIPRGGIFFCTELYVKEFVDNDHLRESIVLDGVMGMDYEKDDGKEGKDGNKC